MMTGSFFFMVSNRRKPQARILRSFTRWVVWHRMFPLALLVIISVSTGLAQNAGDRSFDQLMELPPWFIQPFGIVERQDHPLFGQFCAALGDVNGDGYDDIFHEGYSGGTRFMIYLGRSMKPTSLEVPSETMAMQFDLYPNPARLGDAVRVKLSGVQTGEMHIYDMLGRLMLHATVRPGTTLESASLLAGMYLAVLHTQRGIARSVLVVN